MLQNINLTGSLTWLFFNVTLSSIINHSTNKTKTRILLTPLLCQQNSHKIQGDQQQVQAIILKKKPHEKYLPVEDKSWNATVASNHIIAEYFLVISQNFGVLFLLNTGGRKEEGYDDISTFVWC